MIGSGSEVRNNFSSPWLPRILIIDHHDSYTLNVLPLLASALRIMHTETSSSSNIPNFDTSPNAEDSQISILLSENVRFLPHTHPYLSPGMFDKHLRNVTDALIISPGPGSPERDDDFGAAARLIGHLSQNPTHDSSSPACTPILGICLGHQGLATVFKGSVRRAKFIRHGICSQLRWTKPQGPSLVPGQVGAKGGIFEGLIDGSKVVRYNSLVVEENTLPPCLRVTAWAFDSAVGCAPAPVPNPFTPVLSMSIGGSSSPSPLISSPLRSENLSSRSQDHWKTVLRSDPISTPPQDAPCGPNPRSVHNSTGDEGGEAVILALEHTDLPFWGVQFHPESVESENGSGMINNFLKLVQKWWTKQAICSEEAKGRVKTWEKRNGFPLELREMGRDCISIGMDASLPCNNETPSSKPWVIISRRFEKDKMPSKEKAPQVFDSLFRFGGNKRSHGEVERGVGSVWLDSAKARDPNSRYSYMSSPSFLLSYYSDARQITVTKASKSSVHFSAPLKINRRDQDPPTFTFWSWMDQLQKSLQVQTDSCSCLLDLDSDDELRGTHPPSAHRRVKDLSVWRSGFVGYWGYEMWHENLKDKKEAPTLAPTQKKDKIPKPDAEFGFCDKVLCLDSERDEWVAFALIRDQSTLLPGHHAVSDLQQALNSLQQLSESQAALGLTSKQADAWFDQVALTLQQIARSAQENTKPSSISASFEGSGSCAFQGSRSILPALRPDDEQEIYKTKVEAAREYIASGESYELCLTTQFRGTLPSLLSNSQRSLQVKSLSERSPDELDLDHFSMYKALRSRNPAPYSAFFHLPRLKSGLSTSTSNSRERAILCTSPERFMRVSRTGRVEMKPIKGTLARAGWGVGEESMRPLETEDQLTASSVDAFRARQKKEWREKEDDRRRRCLAADVKERAENLMIVDLIRAELLSFCLAPSVRVPALMQVESYATVHQLVTSVCGILKRGIGPIEAQQRCHAPGSMTGAPKRRSMQILERLESAGEGGEPPYPLSTQASVINTEERRRGIYSGTLGWIGIDGASDMAVVIRTAVVDGDDVSIGAGGAITYLSDPQREWSEVLDKASALAHLDLSPLSEAVTASN